MPEYQQIARVCAEWGSLPPQPFNLGEHPVQMFMACRRVVPIMNPWQARHLHRSDVLPSVLPYGGGLPPMIQRKEALPQFGTYVFPYPEVGVNTFLQMALCTCGDLFVVEQPCQPSGTAIQRRQQEELSVYERMRGMRDTYELQRMQDRFNQAEAYAAEQYRQTYEQMQNVRWEDRVQVGIDWAVPAPDPPHFSEAAKERSRELLRSLLTEEEQREFDRTQTLLVKAPSGWGYRIWPNTTTQVFDSPTNQIGMACLQLTIAAPICDRMIAEYLLLKNDETRYLDTANLSPPSLQLGRRREGHCASNWVWRFMTGALGA